MRPTINTLESDLRRLLKGDVEFDPISRHLYSTDAGSFQIEPLGVVSPRDAEDVAKLVQYATEYGVPLVARGMGSGLAGAAIGTGLQVDFTRYMNRILEWAPDGSWARIEPGLVMGVLNQKAKAYGTFFAPNPSSENYASLGGMIGHNSSGSRSVAYGGTKDHVISIDVVLSGGELFHAHTLRKEDAKLQSLLDRPSLSGLAFAALLPLLAQKEQVIKASMPRVMKNASGYRIEEILTSADGDELVNLHKLFIGAEGTLGLIVEAVVNLVPLPGKRAIAMCYFPTVFSAGEAVFPILSLKPTSLEIMDGGFLRFVRKNDPKMANLIPEQADTALLVEFEAGDDAELAEKLKSLGGLLVGGTAADVIPAIDAGEQKKLWEVRQSAVPLLQKLPGPRRITAFIEDVTVHPDVLPTYIHTLTRLFETHGIEGVMYGHAGDGNIHTRPLLDLKTAKDVVTMQELMDDVVDLVIELKGTPSGEHGDGIIRSRYIPRVYGTEVYGVFKSTKELFDPDGIMNPGKKVVSDAEVSGLAHNLRYGSSYYVHGQTTLLRFPHGEFQEEIEKCHGCGQCKSQVSTSMCPSYKATKREHASPRAKANLLRNIIQGKLDPDSCYTSDAMKAVTDYCIECGMCAVECPSNVNIPKLMLEAKSKYRAGHRGKPIDILLGHADMLYEVTQYVSPLANPFMNQQGLRTIGERLVGIDRRRRMPRFDGRSYAQAARSFQQHDFPVGSTVACFLEVYANFNDHRLARDMERLLIGHGLTVVYPRQKACGVLEMAYGYAERARSLALFNVKAALPYVRKGAWLVSGEPTASFAFKAHYADYLDDPDVAVVAAATRDLGELLVEWRTTHPELALRPHATTLRLAYHRPCHLKAQQVQRSFLDILREIPEVNLVDLNAGCCGMAGTYGAKADTFELAMESGRPVFERVREVGADLVLSECSSCRMQIAQATGVTTAHPAQFLLSHCTSAD